MKVWLDDLRPIREGFDVWAKTAPEAIEHLKTGNVTYISLDHDLGEDEGCGSGYDVASFIEEAAYFNIIPRLKWNVHSANPVGAANMERALKQANNYWDRNEQQGS